MFRLVIPFFVTTGHLRKKLKKIQIVVTRYAQHSIADVMGEIKVLLCPLHIVI